MNFAQFLQDLKKRKKLTSAKDHYAELGGEKTLGISLRHFQQIESGKYPPSEKILARVFESVSASEKRVVLLAFFHSVFSGKSPLIDYLDQHLLPEVEQEQTGLWESSEHSMLYSEEQLEFLSTHINAMRFHRRILLLGKCLKTECDLPPASLNRLVDLKLVVVEKQYIQTSRTRYRVPNFENSGPKAVTKSSDYILTHLDHYISREGSPHQELGYAMQMVSEVAAGRILDQMKAMKRWVHSLASTDSGKGTTPLLYVGFAKKIQSREL